MNRNLPLVKICPRCKRDDQEFFSLCRRGRKYLQPYCKSCQLEDKRARRKSDPSKDRASFARWYDKNPDYYAVRQRERYHTDPQYRLTRCLRSRLTKMVGRQKVGSAVRDLGCSIPELKQYLESKFQPGMSWDNYGQWHVDHIKPLSKFDLSDRNQFLEVCHYTNLQPLWARDNLSKGAR